MFNFRRRESFSEGIGNHVISGAINETDGSVFDDPSDKMKAYINMFSTWVILVVFGECNRRLIIGKKGGSVEGSVE